MCDKYIKIADLEKELAPIVQYLSTSFITEIKEDKYIISLRNEGFATDLEIPVIEKNEIRLGSVEVKFTDVVDFKAAVIAFILDARLLEQYNTDEAELADELLDKWLKIKMEKKGDSQPITPTPLGQSWFDEDNLGGTIRHYLREIVEKVLKKGLSLAPEICFDIALNEKNWKELLSLKSDEMKYAIELEYTDPESQVISKKYSAIIEKMDSEKRSITVEATESEDPAVVKGKMIRTRDDIKTFFEED